MYIVAIKEEFVRDVQVCRDPKDADLPDESGWVDFSGSLILDFSNAKTKEEAIEEISSIHEVSKEILFAYNTDLSKKD